MLYEIFLVSNNHFRGLAVRCPHWEVQIGDCSLLSLIIFFLFCIPSYISIQFVTFRFCVKSMLCEISLVSNNHFNVLAVRCPPWEAQVGDCSLLSLIILFCVPSYFSRVHHFWWDFGICDRPFNPTIEIVTVCLRGSLIISHQWFENWHSSGYSTRRMAL